MIEKTLKYLNYITLKTFDHMIKLSLKIPETFQKKINSEHAAYIYTMLAIFFFFVSSLYIKQ